jgi:hypothetical protein
VSDYATWSADYANWKLGDVIKCIDCSAFADHITEGKTYQVLSVSVVKYKGADEWHVKIMDDEGRICFPFADRFVRLL